MPCSTCTPPTPHHTACTYCHLHCLLQTAGLPRLPRASGQAQDQHQPLHPQPQPHTAIPGGWMDGWWLRQWLACARVWAVCGAWLRIWVLPTGQLLYGCASPKVCAVPTARACAAVARVELQLRNAAGALPVVGRAGPHFACAWHPALHPPPPACSKWATRCAHRWLPPWGAAWRLHRCTRPHLEQCWSLCLTQSIKRCVTSVGLPACSMWLGSLCRRGSCDSPWYCSPPVLALHSLLVRSGPSAAQRKLLEAPVAAHTPRCRPMGFGSVKQAPGLFVPRSA